MKRFYFCLIIVIAIIICIVLENSHKIIFIYPVGVSSLSSSIFCSNSKNNSKRCMFKNLCYNFHTNFMFLLTEKSIISGLNSKNDLKNIFATSVINHSALPLKISVIYPKNFSNVFMYERDIFLLHRFKPDNIMHVIHDDILPLYTTYRDLCYGDISDCVSKYNILFADENLEGSYNEWYKAFSKNEPLQLSKLNKSITYCFSRVNVGLSIDSIIYQYGFQQSRGATFLSVHQVQLIKQFRTYMLNHFEINHHFPKFNVVLIGRKLNRRILNEDYIEYLISETFKNELNISINILNMDLSINSTKELLQSINEANYIIGMHGSGMFLSMFLPDNSVVIEIFPYGIKKEFVSPIFVMSLMPGIWFRYFSWENYNHLNSFPHPEYNPIFGGLSELTRENQVSIFREKFNNPSKLCCNDPLFLSRMYQDTIIDHTFKDIIHLALNKQKQARYKEFDLDKQCMNEWFFPSIVRNMTCTRNQGNIILSWEHPLNIDSTDITYDIAIQTANQNLSVITTTSAVCLKLGWESGFINIWIKCKVLGAEGHDLFISC